VTFQAVTLAAVLAFVGILINLVAMASLPAGVATQPYGVPVEDFLKGINEHTQTILLFFAGDTLFPLSYALVFIGLYLVAAERSRSFALVGLGAGLLAALLDLTENAFLMTYALMAHNGAPVTDPAIIIVYVITTLKWSASFVAFYSFGLVFPRSTVRDKAVVAVMLAYPLVGVVTVALPSFIAVRGLFLLVGMPLFAWYFWGLAQQA
jgi:hypothetical protein